MKFNRFQDGANLTLFYYRDLNGGDADNERRMRREIANSNERRRMQSINAGFQSLRTLLPHHEGEKLSKVYRDMILNFSLKNQLRNSFSLLNVKFVSIFCHKCVLYIDIYSSCRLFDVSYKIMNVR